VMDSVTVRFVKLCLSARWDAGALEAARALAAQGDLDWAELCRVAASERVAPLLYQITQNSGLLPAAVEAELREAYYATAARNLRLLHQLELVLRRLEAEGVAVILLKGAALTQEVYRQPALRPMADLDLLVRREDVPLARRVLAALGYRPPCPALRDDHLDAYSHAVFLAQPEAPRAGLDIHWSLFGSLYYYYRVPMDWFRQTSMPARVPKRGYGVPIGDAPCRVLGPVAQVLHLCAHILQHGARGEVKLLAFHDVAAVLAFYGKEIDWDQLLSKAQAYELVLAVQQVLSRLQQEWRVALPDDVPARLGALQPTPAEQQVFEQLTAATRPAQGFMRDLLAIPGWGARLRMARCILVPSAEYMQWHYRLAQRWLLPLYYPYRWFNSLRGVSQRTWPPAQEETAVKQPDSGFGP
jgi:hypothetical protein